MKICDNWGVTLTQAMIPFPFYSSHNFNSQPQHTENIVKAWAILYYRTKSLHRKFTQECFPLSFHTADPSIPSAQVETLSIKNVKQEPTTC